MKNQFDELAKGLAQSVTRRAALKKFGVSLAGMALAVLGLADKANAGQKQLPGPLQPCTLKKGCQTGLVCRYGRPVTGYYGYYCFPA